MDSQRLIHHHGGRQCGRVIEHHQIAGVEEGREVDEPSVGNPTFTCNHQADPVAGQTPRLRGARSLEFFGDREVLEDVGRLAQGHRHVLTVSESRLSAV
jgi:hypothetical protein